MGMTGLEIFKYLPAGKKLPQANCKKCGCPTCMAFALKLAKQNIEISKCPNISEELSEKYSQNIKHAQKTLQLGNLKIGGENVLYRHEKTFINRTTLAVIVDTDFENYENILNQIENFQIKRITEFLNVDLVILKGEKSEEIKTKFLFKNSIVNVITYDEFKNLDLDIIEDFDFLTTKNYLISTRKKAILEKDDSCSKPVCVVMDKNLDKFSTTARASFYLCKYANMLIFNEFDEAMFSTLLTLRQNIFTDPQKSLQVESDLYKFNNPDENSTIFLTTNFALTFFAVANELEKLEISSYLIVIPAEGMSVLTAWSAEKFTANIVAETIKKLQVREKINTRRIIIPGLLAHIKDELQEACPDFEFVVGSLEASEIANFIQKLDN